MGLFYHSPFAEEQDAPVIVIGVMTLSTSVGGLVGAGHGSLFSTVAGLALGILAGFCSGMVVLMAYSVLRWIYLWAREQIRGY